MAHVQVQQLERRSGWALEVEGQTGLEAYGRYRMAKQWRRVEVRLREMAWGMARQVGLDLIQCEWRARVVQKEQTRWIARGVRQLWEAEAIDCEFLATIGIGGAKFACSGAR